MRAKVSRPFSIAFHLVLYSRFTLLSTHSQLKVLNTVKQDRASGRSRHGCAFYFKLELGKLSVVRHWNHPAKWGELKVGVVMENWCHTQSTTSAQSVHHLVFQSGNQFCIGNAYVHNKYELCFHETNGGASPIWGITSLCTFTWKLQDFLRCGKLKKRFLPPKNIEGKQSYPLKIFSFVTNSFQNEVISPNVCDHPRNHLFDDKIKYVCPCTPTNQ